MSSLKLKAAQHLNLNLKKNQLVTEILTYVRNEELTYTEAILAVCDDHEIDPEDMAKLVTGQLKEKLRIEAINCNSVKADTKIKFNTLIDECV